MATPNLLEETVGPWGARVRIREHKGGKVVLMFSNRDPDKSGYDREALDFQVRNPDGSLNAEAVRHARQEARNLSDLLERGKLPDDLEPAPAVTFGELFDLFREYELPHKSEQRQRELRRHLQGMERFLGPGLAVHDFSAHDWNRYARERQRGVIDSRGRRIPPEDRKPRSATTAAYGLAILRQACRWGAGFRPRSVGCERELPEGRRYLLASDPTRDNGCQLPKSKNPPRPVCSDQRFRALLEVADQVRIGHGNTSVCPPLRELLILARGTGRRIGAILALRWGDWNPDAHTHGELRWRAEEDKIGREWRAPVIRPVHTALEGLQRARLAQHGVPGAQSWVFPALEAQDKHVRVDVARQWLLRAEELAGLDHPRGFGWHAFRRAWATRRKDLPSQDVAAAGGWADTQALQLCYQHADPATTERVVLSEGSLPGLDADADTA